MTISGKLPQGDFGAIEIQPISTGQGYIAALESELARTDGAPVWFVHDGSTGTSHDLICEAQEHYHMQGSLEDTRLFRLMRSCVESGDTFRLWWASDAEGCHRRLVDFATFGDLLAGLCRAFERGWICVSGIARKANHLMELTRR
jgi:hypothetical protein